MPDVSKLNLDGVSYSIKDDVARTAINNEINARQSNDATLQNNINVEKARIDQIAALPSGSTSGDAELIDIRVGADGVTYANAGTAVREQINDINSKITTGKQLFNKNEYTSGYYYNYTNGELRPNASWCYYKIPIGGSVTFSINRAAMIAYFNSTGTFISGDLNSNNVYASYTTPSNTTYMMFSCSIGNADSMLVELGSSSTIYEDYYNRFKYEDPWKSVRMYVATVNTSTYTAYLADFDNALDNVSYIIDIPTKEYRNLPLNNPYGQVWEGRGLCLLITYSVSATRKVQMFFDGVTTYKRSFISSGWVKWTNKKVVVVDKNGNGDFTSLTEAFSFLKYQFDYTCYINAGVYDLIEEFEDKYGSTYFDDYTAQSSQDLYVGNRNRFIFSPQSKVTFHYTGTNAAVNKYFSPFNTGTYGGELDGLNLSASNCRYGIHDERTTHDDFYYNIYRNCNIYLDNRNNIEFSSRRCIGAGLGINGRILIDGCRFKAETPAGNNTVGIVWYHNTTANTGKSDIHVKNCYFDGDGTVEVTAIGGSTEITECYVSGCHLGSAPVHSIETGYTIDNVALYSFCNEIA